MLIEPLNGDEADDVLDTITATDGYQQFSDYLADRDVSLSNPSVFRVEEDGSRYLAQVNLTGLGDNTTGLLELSVDDGTVTRGVVIIDERDADGELVESTQYNLDDGQIRRTTTSYRCR